MNKKTTVTLIIIAILVVLLATVAVILSGKKNVPEKNESYTSDTVSGSEKGENEKEENDSALNKTESEKTESGNKKGGGASTSTPIVKEPIAPEIKKEEDKIIASSSDKEITVPIKITKNPGFYASNLILRYDTDAFDLVALKNGDICENCSSNLKDGILYSLITSELKAGSVDVTKTGTLANLVLKPKAGIKTGTYKIHILSDSNFANLNESFVKVTLKTYDIEIK